MYIHVHCKHDVNLRIIIGANFGVWTGGLAYPGCPVALLAAVVTGGFHAQSAYSWSYSGVTLSACYPIMYSQSRGEFSCHILTKFKDEEKRTDLIFSVSVYL